MMMANQRRPKLLFVISNDYGELGNARYVLYGQDSLIANSSFLLPQKLIARNARIFGCSTQEYRTIDDILRAIEALQPNIVFLFSGYLFAWDKLMTAQSLAKIVKLSQTHGFKLVTSDPYLGLLSEPVTTIAQAHDSFPELFDVLKDQIHFYPVPCNQLAPSCDIRGVSTFNEKLVCRDRRPTLSSPVADIDEAGTWLFVLGSNDYEIQTSVFGTDLFVSKLAAKFRYALSVGRRPMLIAPDQCGRILREKLGSDVDRVELISFCGYDEFTALLLDAEAAFYWNLVSNSMFHRVLNGLPNFFFDPGHLGRIQPIYELAIENYFAGWEPVCLDYRQDFSLELLRLVDRVFQRETMHMREQFQRAPNPQDFVARIHSGTW